MHCKHCEHNCHCNRKCSVCECLNCEHNALDEFWERLEENAGIIMNLSKHRD